jgi:DNA repair protein RecN (Recombination protein N)
VRRPLRKIDAGACAGCAALRAKLSRVLRRLRIENLVLIREAELDLAPGLNAITGETGAGKTILAQSIGLLLGARGDATMIGPAGEEAYVEAELDGEPNEALAELQPSGEPGLVLARRIFADGRTRAYAWGRAAAREDVAAAAEEAIAMSGQFQQRRLARPSYQLDLLDAFAEAMPLRARAATAWRELAAARKRHEETAESAARRAERLAELRALVEDTEGLEPDTETELRARRETLQHLEELVAGAAAAAEALAPEDGEGAAWLAARAERAIAPLESLAPELARAGDELRDVELRLRETATDLRAYLATLGSEPQRLEETEAQLDRIADTRRRFHCGTYEELLAHAAEAHAELAAVDAGVDPADAAARALAAAEARVQELATELRALRQEAAPGFAEAVSAELAGLGLGEGEFQAVVSSREPGPTGADEVRFLIRPNPGLPLAPVADTASGGELSRIALAIAVVAGGDTLVFDELDAGIGGETANAVGRALARAAEQAQVITITHLPQIAGLAARHFSVEKVPGDPTHTRIAQLDDDERARELERMLGGAAFLETLKR